MNRQEAKHLLPWYLAGKLSRDEMQAVQELVDRGEISSADLDAVRLVGEALAEPDQEAPRYDPQLLERVLETHQASPEGGHGVDAPVVVVKESPRATGHPDSLFERLGARMQWPETPAPVRTALAILATLVLGLALALLLAATPPDRDVPQPLSSALPGDYTVTFAPGVTEAQMRALLLEVRARIVAGPSAVGLYAISFDSEIDARAAVERIDASGLVTFLQPAPRP